MCKLGMLLYFLFSSIGQCIPVSIPCDFSFAGLQCIARLAILLLFTFSFYLAIHAYLILPITFAVWSSSKKKKYDDIFIENIVNSYFIIFDIFKNVKQFVITYLIILNSCFDN